MSLTRPLRVGLASFAHVHAAGYAALLRERPDVELLAADPDAATAPPDERRGQDLADDLGVRLLGSYDELFAADLDAIIVCTENARHRALVERAAAEGVHVLCEKPLATTVEDAEAMVRACVEAGVLLMTAYPVRFHPAFAALRERVRAGELGSVLAVVGTNNGQAPLAARRWFLDRELAGGGSLMDHTVHLADLLDSLLQTQPVTVYAQVNQVVHAGVVDVETGGLVVLDYGDGLVATIDCSWSAPASYPSWGGLTLSVEGERGAVTLDAFAERIEVFDDTVGGLRWARLGVNLDALMLDAFLEGVRSGEPVQPDGGVGLRTLRVVEAAYDSVRRGEPVALT